MKKQFGNNLKFLREERNLTQSALAGILAEGDSGMQKKIGSYEQGIAFPQPELVKEILNFFGMKYEHMTEYDLASLSARGLRDLRQGKSSDLQILTISVDSDNHENIELVPEQASAGYIRGFSDRDYIKQLDKFHMPWLPPEYTYRAFEISGDSMPPIESGSIVLGRYVENKQDIKKGERYIIVSKDGILFKRIYTPTKTKTDPALLLTSDNPRYEPYEIPYEEILEIWQFYAFVSLCIDK